jgi:hypothetical protein
MIWVENLMDEAAYPNQAEFYHKQVETALGDGVDDHYRLWFVDHAMHNQPIAFPADARPVRTTRVVSFIGVLHQALRDLADWVEKGLAPPPSTEYAVVDGQVVVPPSAKARRGIQPVVTLTANGGEKTVVGVGEAVRFCGVAEVPPGAGTVVAAEWDFEGGGDYPRAEPGMDGDLANISLTTSYAFDQPGTYFPALRVTSQRQGDSKTPHTRIVNLARVRVIVQ